MISGQEDIRKAYQDDQVAGKYVARRFQTPLGALLHARQVRAVRDLIREQGIERAVEIAPGPARLTVDVAPALTHVTLVDASAQMLAEARRRLAARGLAARVSLVQADAFKLPLQQTRDLVYTFRLIRHFERDDRVRLYRQMATILRPGGWLVFDAVNERVSAPLRARARADDHVHFDALLRPESITEELRESGFALESLVAVQRRYTALLSCQIYLAPRSEALARGAMEIIDRSGGEPLEWVVICRRG